MALAYAPWQIVALIDGPSTLLLNNGTTQQVDHDRAVAVLTFEEDGRASFSGDVPNIKMTSLGGTERLTVHMRPSIGSDSGTDIAVSIARPVYQPPGLPALALDQMSLLGVIQDGRRLAVTKTEINSGNIKVQGSGMISLDAENRISGELISETNDINSLIELISAHLGLSGQQTANIQGIMGILGDSAKIPIVARDGLLYLGPFNVAGLRPLY